MSDLRATFLERLTDPRAVPILARHAIPVIGVFVFGWSVLETIAALFLDALSSLWAVGGVAAYFAAKQFDYGESGLIPALNFWAAVFGTFVFAAGLFTFTIGVPAFMLLPLVQGADLDPWTLVTSGWLPRAFGLMVACQVPGVLQRVRAAEASGVRPEKIGMDAETGFLLHRTVMLAMIGSMLAVFGAYALRLLVVVGQIFGACAEIMRDHYVGYLMAARTEGSSTPPTTPPRTPVLRRLRKRRRR